MGSVCLQEHFEQPSEQLQRSDGPVKSSLRKITSEVNTALVLIKWLSVLAVEKSPGQTPRCGFSCGFLVGRGSGPICSGFSEGRRKAGSLAMAMASSC